MARTPSPEDFLLVPLAISRAIRRWEAGASARQQLLAISAASELRQRRRKVLVAPWAGGSHLETLPAGPCSRRLESRAMRRAEGGVPSEG